MENSFASEAAAKSDNELKIIVNERYKNEPEAVIAAIDELQRRGFSSPEVQQERARMVQMIDQRNSGHPTTASGGGWKDMLSLLKISNDYFYTPLLIYANVIIWVLMVITGVDAFSPSVDSLIRWGGNAFALTLEDQRWRLLTSTFLHGGLIHLLLNMFALVQIGGILETQFGKHRFILVYLATGVLASMASCAFSQSSVSVGASGAIFGLFGLFLALLLSKSFAISAEARKSLLSGTLTFIGYNVAFGFAQAGIDNAAHLGGLLSGFVIGYAYYPFRTKPVQTTIVSIVLLVTVLAFAWSAPHFISNPYAKYQAVVTKIVADEQRAQWMSEPGNAVEPGTPEAQAYYEKLKTEGIDIWEENLAMLNSLDGVDEKLGNRISLLKKYCELKRDWCIQMQVLTRDKNNPAAIKRLNEINNQLNNVVQQNHEAE